jgi:hypothetical protein
MEKQSRQGLHSCDRKELTQQSIHPMLLVLDHVKQFRSITTVMTDTTESTGRYVYWYVFHAILTRPFKLPRSNLIGLRTIGHP